MHGHQFRFPVKAQPAPVDLGIRLGFQLLRQGIQQIFQLHTALGQQHRPAQQLSVVFRQLRHMEQILQMHIDLRLGGIAVPVHFHRPVLLLRQGTASHSLQQFFHTQAPVVLQGPGHQIHGHGVAPDSPDQRILFRILQGHIVVIKDLPKTFLRHGPGLHRPVHTAPGGDDQPHFQLCQLSPGRILCQFAEVPLRFVRIVDDQNILRPAASQQFHDLLIVLLRIRLPVLVARQALGHAQDHGVREGILEQRKIHPSAGIVGAEPLHQRSFSHTAQAGDEDLPGSRIPQLLRQSGKLRLTAHKMALFQRTGQRQIQGRAGLPQGCGIFIQQLLNFLELFRGDVFPIRAAVIPQELDKIIQLQDIRSRVKAEAFRLQISCVQLCGSLFPQLADHLSVCGQKYHIQAKILQLRSFGDPFTGGTQTVLHFLVGAVACHLHEDPIFPVTQVKASGIDPIFHFQLPSVEYIHQIPDHRLGCLVNIEKAR